LGAIITFFREGGSWMYIILLVGIAGISVMVERVLYISIKNRIDTVAFVNRVLELLQRGNITNAVEFCRMSQASLPRIVRAGLEEAGKRPKDIQQAFELASMVEIPKLEKRTHFLGMIANVATLLGSARNDFWSDYVIPGGCECTGGSEGYSLNGWYFYCFEYDSIGSDYRHPLYDYTFLSSGENE